MAKKYSGTFRCVVLSHKRLVFEKEIKSIFIKGDKGEYELLAYHYPLVGLLQRGSLIIDDKTHIPVKSGIVRFFANECNVLIEESHNEN